MVTEQLNMRQYGYSCPVINSIRWPIQPRAVPVDAFAIALSHEIRAEKSCSATSVECLVFDRALIQECAKLAGLDSMS